MNIVKIGAKAASAELGGKRGVIPYSSCPTILPNASSTSFSRYHRTQNFGNGILLFHRHHKILCGENVSGCKPVNGIFNNVSHLYFALFNCKDTTFSGFFGRKPEKVFVYLHNYIYLEKCVYAGKI
jgi:hypothetical protein